MALAGDPGQIGDDVDGRINIPTLVISILLKGGTIAVEGEQGPER